MQEENSVGGEACRPGRAECVFVFVLLVGMLGVNLATSNLYPTVWADEVLWSDPAINLIQTGHFSTSVWQLQPAGSFWAAQSPLYCFLLTGWLALTGTTLLAVRSFNYVLLAIAALLIWRAAWQYRIVPRPWQRMVLIILMMFGYGMSFSYRCARPDIAGLVCLACLPAAFAIRRPALRNFALFLAGMAAAGIGVQVGLYAFVACLGGWLLLRAVTLRQLVLISAGLAAGAGLVLALFAAKGVLGSFLDSMSQAVREQEYFQHRAGGHLVNLGRRLLRGAGMYLHDFSMVPLVFGFVCFWLLAPARTRPASPRVILYLLALYLVVPPLFSSTAHFAFYYSYMIFVPFTVAFLAYYESISVKLDRRRAMIAKGVFVLAVVSAVLLGLPLRLALSRAFCEIGPRTVYANSIQTRLRPDDVVFADYTAYFEARAVAANVYSPMYSTNFVNLSSKAHDFSPEEKKRVTVLIIPSASSEKIKGYFGGNWAAVSEPFGDSSSVGRVSSHGFISRALDAYFIAPQNHREPLQVWRRVAE